MGSLSWAGRAYPYEAASRTHFYPVIHGDLSVLMLLQYCFSHSESQEGYLSCDDSGSVFLRLS